ncbi:MAG: chorismate-binding protein [Bacteroidota bacterium]
MISEQAKSVTDKLNSWPPEKTIEALANWATSYNLPFAVYQMPNQQHFTFLVGTSIQLINDDNLASINSGYLISSYEGEKYLIEQALIYNSEQGEIKLSAHWSSDINIDSIGDIDEPWQPYCIENKCDSSSHDEYLQYVTDCIDEINHSDLIKVVPSRVKKINLNKLNLSALFLKLCNAYKNAYVSLLSTPNLGTWVGATPESLIELDENGTFQTMSLAGTQVYNGQQELHTLPWTQKEIEEQAMVSRYIINRFKEIRLREFLEVGPRTVQAGNLAHLCTTFTVDTVATEFPDLGSVMLKLLHPTSAVCGMPKTPAQELIREKEKHQRKLYAGYFGPVNMKEGSHIYVNLRCMQVGKDEAVLYAGGGVTAYSIAENEWEETEIKFKTLLNIIQD